MLMAMTAVKPVAKFGTIHLGQTCVTIVSAWRVCSSGDYGFVKRTRDRKV